MQTLERPANGRARFDDADFAEVLRTNDLPLGPPVNDPIQSPGSIAKPERKPLRNAAFQKLFAEIECEEKAPAKSNLPTFPLHALPPKLREWAEAVARQTQTAPEAAAMLGLAASSAAIAGRVKIHGPNGSWQPLNLFVGVLSGGDRCDEVMSAAIEPLRELEFEELENAELQRAKDRVFLREQPRTLREMERKAEAAGDERKLEGIDEGRAELEMYELTPAPRRILDDVTARSLRYQLGQLDRIACFSPTGEIFRQMAGRTCAARQRLFDTLDAGHAARNFVVDGPRGKQTPVKHPAITIASLVDRSTVSSIANQRECHARSLLAQFLYVAPESRVGSRERGEAIAPQVAAAYREGIRSLATRKWNLSAKLTQLVAHCASFHHPTTPAVGDFTNAIVLDPVAQEMLKEFESELEPQLGPCGALAPISEWGKKLANTTLRIAGILHAWTTENPIVSAPTFTAAMEIARWLVPQAAHALEQFGAADDDCTERERALLRYARAAGEFSPRDAWQHLRKTFLHTSALRRALAQLVRRGYLRVAREGERFPRRFALAALSVVLVPVGQVANLSRKKKAKTGPLSNLSYETPPVWPPNESTESTQPLVGVPPSGGLKDG